MACKTSYAWNHNFPRLAAESGFSFSSHRPRVVLDWNRIRLLDIEGLVKDRNFQLVEQHINDVVDCNLESEFDVRILDDGVVKLFRVAQLAAEYQLFCRQYLDRSVRVLKDELAEAMQELERIRREIRIKDDEIRKLRRKAKPSHRTPLPYGNENIAAMILRTLSNRGDIFAGTSIGEAVPQYNKCQYCDKVFLNQLYLQSHISRRHAELNGQAKALSNREMAPKDLPEKISPKDNPNAGQDTEILHLRNEVKALKDKLRETESALNAKSGESKTVETQAQINENYKISNGINDEKNDVFNGIKKDENANDNTFIEKFEEWKRQEHDKYSTEVNELRKQLMENINLFKETALTNAASKENYVEQLRMTVKGQETQINSLKEQLSKVLTSPSSPHPDVTSELQKQDEAWRQRLEQLESQHEAKLDQLLRTLETVYKEVKAAREVGEEERSKVAELQALLAERDNEVRELREARSAGRRESSSLVNSSYHNQTPSASRRPSITSAKSTDEITPKHRISRSAPHAITPGKSTLDELHRKAQELLSRNLTTDSGSTDSPDESESPQRGNGKSARKLSLTKSELRTSPKTVKSSAEVTRARRNRKKESKDDTRLPFGDSADSPKRAGKMVDDRIKKMRKSKRSESESGVDLEEDTNVTASPTKVIRAKLSEEVNSRLLRLGVEPLRGGVPAAAYTQQHTLLQRNAHAKAKKDAAYGKMRNRIMTYLDAKVTQEAEPTAEITQKLAPNNQQKTSKGSFFSSVKNKALSLMKSSDKIAKVERSVAKEDVAKRAAQLLKTPPGSAPSSPVLHRRSSTDSRSLFPERVKRALTRMTSKESPSKPPSPKSQSVEVLYNRKDKVPTDSESEATDSESTSTLEDFTNGRSKNSGLKVITSAIAHEPSKSIENLIKSPMRKPTFDADKKLTNIESGKRSVTNSPTRPASATATMSHARMYDMGTDSGDNSDVHTPDGGNPRKFLSEENLLTRSSPTSTKGVLKNAPSNSSLSKKKVLFDLEANQMKSVSASPSQSVTEGNEETNRGANHIININNDWEISSIEDVPVKEVNNQETYTLESRRSPKIAELTQRIESQLAARGEVKRPAGAVQVMNQSASNVLMSGSNTSVGSSLLDDSNEFEGRKASPGRSKTPIPAPRYVTTARLDKDASDLDVSDWSIDDILKGK